VGGVRLARARNIKPGFFRDEYIVQLPFEARLLFIGLWTLADREGRLKDKPGQIKMELFPCDKIDINKHIQALQSKGFLVRYSVEGQGYIQVINFIKHQNPHIKEQASEIPAPDMHGACMVQTPDLHGASPADSPFLDSPLLIPESPIPIKHIVEYLNTVCGTDYRETTKTTIEVINARWKDGFKLEDFKKVIDKKAADWLNSKEYARFLRPVTLFGTKFESYLNQVEAVDVPEAWHIITEFGRDE